MFCSLLRSYTGQTQTTTTLARQLFLGGVRKSLCNDLHKLLGQIYEKSSFGRVTAVATFIDVQNSGVWSCFPKLFVILAGNFDCMKRPRQ